MYNAAFEKLPDSLRIIIISVILKPGRVWVTAVIIGQFSLINVVCKILTQAIAKIIRVDSYQD